jgi:hypothetical protein
VTYEERVEDIRKRPEAHRHLDLNGVNACCVVTGSAITVGLVDAHQGVYGTNGGVGCDVAHGPCSCGAFH